MALILSGTTGSSPAMAYELHAEQTGGSGNSRTIKATLKLKTSGSSQSWYGYPMNHKIGINGNWQAWQTSKGSETWRGGMAWKEWTYTITTDVGTSASTGVSVGFQTDSYNGSNNWDFNRSGTFTVGQTNTPPYFNSSEQWLRIRNGSSSGAVLTGVIPENVSTVYMDWGYASDSEGGTITYILQEQVNGGGWNTVDTGTDRAHSINIGSGNEGQSRKYWVTAKDNSNAQATSGVYSATITKNTLTAGWFTGHSNDVNFDTNEFTLMFTGGANSDGSGFSYNCYSHDVAVHNQIRTTGTTQKIKIWKSGAYPTDSPYIKFEDLKSFYRNKNFNGRLHVGVATHNNHGTTKHVSGSIGVDLRKAPVPVPSCQIEENSNSTAYKMVASTKNWYFIPESDNHIQVKWTAGSCYLGTSIKYDLFAAYGSGSWQLVASDLTGLSYNHKVSKQTATQQIKYKIRTKSAFNYQADRDTSAKSLHFYNAPSLAVGTITRGASNVEVTVTVKTHSSIPNINTVGTWELFNKGTSTKVKNGSLTITQVAQIIKIDGLTDNGQYDLKVTYTDDTKFSGNNLITIAIGANSPIFFVNKYGVGVGGNKADSKIAFSVKGRAYFSDGINSEKALGANVNLNDIKDVGEYQQNSNANTSLALNYPEALAGHLTVTTGAGTQQRYHIYNTSRVYVRAQYDKGSWTAWAKQYNTANKPTPSEIGAMATGDKPAWASNADNATRVSGKSFNWVWGNGRPTHIWGAQGDEREMFVYPVNAQGVNCYNSFPFIGTDGVMEIGKYIDFHDNTAADFSVRLTASGNILDCSGVFAASTYRCSDWYYVSGNGGLYNSTHDGGWFMNNGEFIKSYNNKSIYTAGNMYIDGGAGIYTNWIEDINGIDGWIKVDSGNLSQISFRPQADNRNNLGSRDYTWDFASIRSVASTYSIEKKDALNVTKFNDNESMYNMVKDMSFYLENTSTADAFIEDEEIKLTQEYIDATDEEKKTLIRKNEIRTATSYSKGIGTKLIANACELPYEVAPETKATNGERSVDLGSMVTGLASALQMAIQKIETLENEINILKDGIV